MRPASSILSSPLLLLLYAKILRAHRCARNEEACSPINPFRTAVPFGDKTTLNLTGLSPERDCGSKRVNRKNCWAGLRLGANPYAYASSTAQMASRTSSTKMMQQHIAMQSGRWAMLCDAIIMDSKGTTRTFCECEKTERNDKKKTKRRMEKEEKPAVKPRQRVSATLPGI